MTMFEEVAEILVSRDNIRLGGVLLQLLRSHQIQQIRFIVLFTILNYDLPGANQRFLRKLACGPFHRTGGSVARDQLIFQLFELADYEARLPQHHPASRAEMTGETGLDIPGLSGEHKEPTTRNVSDY